MPSQSLLAVESSGPRRGPVVERKDPVQVLHAAPDWICNDLHCWCLRVFRALREQGVEAALERCGSRCELRVYEPTSGREAAFSFVLGEERTLLTTLLLRYGSDAQRQALLPGFERCGNEAEEADAR